MKNILITGASDGIGKQIAIALDKKGYNLYLFGRNKEKLDSLNLNNIKRKDAFDLKDRETLYKVLKEIKEEVNIDVIVNNAGFNAQKAEVKDIQIKDLEDMFEVNVISGLIIIQELIDSMIENKDGMIVNVLSSCCKFDNPNSGGYSASKCAMESLSKILVKEVKDKGVKVLDVYPGGVDTNFRKIDRPDYLNAQTVAKHIVYAIENNDDGMIQEIVVRPTIENNY